MPWTRGKVLAFMASFAAAAGEARMAEGYLLELLSWCAFQEYRPQ